MRFSRAESPLHGFAILREDCLLAIRPVTCKEVDPRGSAAKSRLLRGAHRSLLAAQLFAIFVDGVDVQLLMYVERIPELSAQQPGCRRSAKPKILNELTGTHISSYAPRDAIHRQCNHLG